MPRNSAPHFKLLCSFANHRKTIEAYSDDTLLAFYVRLGVLAIERYADRTENVFYLNDQDLMRCANRQTVQSARRIARLASEKTPIKLRQEPDKGPSAWVCEWPNFAKKQFPRREDGTYREGSASASASTTAYPPVVPPRRGDPPSGENREVRRARERTEGRMQIAREGAEMARRLEDARDQRRADRRADRERQQRLPPQT